VTPIGFVRGHLFKLWHKSLSLHVDIRGQLATVKTLDEMWQLHEMMKTRLQESEKEYISQYNTKWENRFESPESIPHWICQPHLRQPLNHNLKKENHTGNGTLDSNGDSVHQDPNKPAITIDSNSQGNNTVSTKRSREDNGLDTTTPKKVKQKKPVKVYLKCINCANPGGEECAFRMCKPCCKKHCLTSIADCEKHRFWIKSKTLRQQQQQIDQQNGNNLQNQESIMTNSCT